MRAALLAALAAGALAGYPLDGAAKTKIRRLTAYRLAHEGKVKSHIKLPPGALLASSQIALRLQDAPEFDIGPATLKDPKLQAGLEAIFAGRDPSYNIAVLDVSDPRKPRYAALRADQRYIPGSVAKLFVATGVFGALAAARGARARAARDHRDRGFLRSPRRQDRSLLQRR
jgi:hypothetical protein